MKLRGLAVALAAFVSISLAGPASGLTLQTEPDILADVLSVTYLAGSDDLTITGFVSSLFTDGVSEDISSGTFSLTATVDNGGNLTGLATSNTLTVGGTVPTLGYNTGPVLTGQLTSVGGTTGVLDILFDVTSGEAAGLYGSSGGMIVSFSGFPGHWNSDFSTSFSSVGDIGVPVPEPSAALLLALGGAIFVRRTRAS